MVISVTVTGTYVVGLAECQEVVCALCMKSLTYFHNYLVR